MAEDTIDGLYAVPLLRDFRWSLMDHGRTSTFKKRCPMTMHGYLGSF